jgi:hypothetical protein
MNARPSREAHRHFLECQRGLKPFAAPVGPPGLEQSQEPTYTHTDTGPRAAKSAAPGAASAERDVEAVLGAHPELPDDVLALVRELARRADKEAKKE